MKSSRKPIVLLLGEVLHAQDEWRALSSLAELREVRDGDRKRFLGDCRSGVHDGILAISRTYDSVELTGRFDQELIDLLPQSLKFISHNGAGYDQIDAEACANRGIAVSNTPGAVNASTANTAIYLLLGALRRAHIPATALRQGQWRGSMGLGHDPEGKMLGILGMGGIGSALAVRAAPFGLKMQYHNRNPVVYASSNAVNVQYVGFEKLLRTSDIISIHLPLNSSTKGLIGRKEFRMMKDGVVIVNTARGKIMDEEALVEALDGGKVFAAGLDVYEKEPEVHPGLIRSDKVVLTPHVGTATLETVNITVSMHYLLAPTAAILFSTIMTWFYGAPIYHTITDGLRDDFFPAWIKWENPFKSKALIEYADHFISFQADRIIPSVIPGATSIGRPYIVREGYANLTAAANDIPAPQFVNATFLRGNVYITNPATDVVVHTENSVSGSLLMIVALLALVGAYLFYSNRRLATKLKSESSLGKLMKKLFDATKSEDEAAVALIRRLKQELQQHHSGKNLVPSDFSSHMDYILAVIDKANTSVNGHNQTILTLHTLTEERDNLLKQRDAADDRANTSVNGHNQTILTLQTLTEERDNLLKQRDAADDRANTSVNEHNKTTLTLHTLTEERDNLLKQRDAADEGKGLAQVQYLLSACLVLDTKLGCLQENQTATARDLLDARQTIEAQKRDADKARDELDKTRKQCGDLQADKSKMEQELKGAKATSLAAHSSVDERSDNTGLPSSINDTSGESKPDASSSSPPVLSSTEALTTPRESEPDEQTLSSSPVPPALGSANTDDSQGSKTVRQAKQKPGMPPWLKSRLAADEQAKESARPRPSSPSDDGPSSAGVNEPKNDPPPPETSPRSTDAEWDTESSTEDETKTEKADIDQQSGHTEQTGPQAGQQASGARPLRARLGNYEVDYDNRVDMTSSPDQQDAQSGQDTGANDQSTSSPEVPPATPSGSNVEQISGSDDSPPSSSEPPAVPSGSNMEPSESTKPDSGPINDPPSTPTLPSANASSGTGQQSGPEGDTTPSSKTPPLPLTFGASPASPSPSSQPEGSRGGRGGRGGRGNPQGPYVPRRLRDDAIFIIPKRRGGAQQQQQQRRPESSQHGQGSIRPQDGGRDGGAPSPPAGFERPLVQGTERLHGRWRQDMGVVGATEADWPRYMDFRRQKEDEAVAAQREGRVVRKLEGFPDRWQM
ncbi:MAG: hypothetical protein LQ352_005804 [Teloschistes flavicans]|nr:MAG: hypothetical protein LQ352_005804 [Teloschistes flavicans]